MSSAADTREAAPARRVGRASAAFLSVLTQLFALISAAAVLAVAAITTIDVTRRELVGGSVPGAVEYSEILLVAIVFLGLAEAQRRGTHISMEIVTNRLSSHAGARLKTVGLLIGLALLLWMSWETGEVARRAWETGEYRFGLARIPTWPAKTLIPIGLLLFALQVVRELSRTIALARRKRPPADDAHR